MIQEQVNAQTMKKNIIYEGKDGNVLYDNIKYTRSIRYALDKLLTTVIQENLIFHNITICKFTLTKV